MSKTDRFIYTFFINPLLGAVVVFLILALLMGPSQALGLILVSIICTGGVTLIFWIPLVIAVGNLVMWLFYFKKFIHIIPSSEHYISDQVQLLINYIKEARENKMDDEEITNNLIGSGWPISMVKDAFGRI